LTSPIRDLGFLSAVMRRAELDHLINSSTT
jgi:hypothetical protein